MPVKFLTNGREELNTVILCQLSAKRIDRNVESSSICLKLKTDQKMQPKEITSRMGHITSAVGDPSPWQNAWKLSRYSYEVSSIENSNLVEGVANNFNVQLIKVLLRNTVEKEGGCIMSGRHIEKVPRGVSTSTEL